MVKGKNNPYNYSLILSVIVVVVVTLAGLFVIKPLFSTIIKMNNDKKAKAATLSNMQKREEILFSLKDKEDEYKQNSETISNALPTQDDIGRLFIQLDTIATDSGGTLQSVTMSGSGTSAVSTNVTEQTYVIPLKMPDYFSLKKFISSSEDALRLLSIKDIDIASDSSGVLTINITAKSYTRTK